MDFRTYIKKLIESNGPLSVASFMTEMLQNPEYGYYKNNVILGEGGDFITAPEASQLFGEMIGVWVALVWQSMKKPSSFILLEYGPGKGTMMKDIIRATANIENLHDSMEIHLIETSPVLKDIQKENLSDINIEISWHNNLSTVPDKPVIIVANEFFDALPIHQYYKTADGWYERVITYSNDSEQFEFILGKALFLNSDLKKQHESAAIGSYLEISQVSCSVMQEISEYINKNSGAALIIDYGYSSFTYKNTIQSLKLHKFNDIFNNQGEADITSYVNFMDLRNIAQKEGISCFFPVTQRDFLLSLGIDIRLDMLLSKLTDKKKTECLNNGFNRLVSKEEMGELFKVFIVQSNNFHSLFNEKKWTD